MAEHLLLRTALVGRFMKLNPAGSSTAVITNGLLYFMPFDLGAPATIDQTLIECITTPGGAGSVIRGAWYRDDGTFDKPGSLIADLGTVDTTTTGLKTFATTLTLPPGRVWCGMVAQGVPTPNPTVRTCTVAKAIHSVPTMSGTTFVFLTQSGITAALPDPAVQNGGSSIAVDVAVRFA